MKRLIAASLLIACLGLGACAQNKEAKEASLPKVYNEQLDAMRQIDSAVAVAAQSGRYVLCQVGGNWCPWCLRFANFATTDSVVAPLLEQRYVYLHVNYSKANKNLEAMRRLGNPGRFGYPVFVVLDGQGQRLHTQESASLEEGKGYNRQRVEKFLRLWSKEAVEADVK